MRIGTLYGSSSVMRSYISNRFPYFSPIFGGAEALDRVREVEVDAEAAGTDAAALVADLLGRARGDVAGGEVAVGRVLALEVVVALVLRDLVGRAGVALLLRHPDAAVVAQRLAHERELALVVAVNRDAGRVDLRVAGVRESGALLVGAPDRGAVGSPSRRSRGRRRSRSRRSRARPRRRGASRGRPSPCRGPRCRGRGRRRRRARASRGARAASRCRGRPGA